MSENFLKEIPIETGKPYSVFVGNGILHTIGSRIKSLKGVLKVGILTDDIVEKLYLSHVVKSIEECGFTVFTYVIKNGEESKNLENFGKIHNFLAESGFSRSDVIVALGGGVVGDLCGFVASTYMRGIKFVQVPTTLLAQIDSSVGGKTAVDLPYGKNLVGSFYQPCFVVCDIDVLSTLPTEIFQDGLFEMAKYGVLIGGEFFQKLKGDFMGNLPWLIEKSIEYKGEIVKADEFENGDRKLLNLGHTIAHGIEKLSNYTISHGKAVGMGLREMARICHKNGLLDGGTLVEIGAMLENLGQVDISPYDMKDIEKTISLDKKCSGGSVDFVVAYGLSKCKTLKVQLDKVGEFIQ